MYLANQKLILVLISIINAFILLIIYFYLQKHLIVKNLKLNYYDESKINDLISEKQTNRNDPKDLKINLSRTNSMFNKLKIKTNAQWIVNKHVLQYSAYVIYKGNSIKSRHCIKDRPQSQGH